MQHQRNRRKPAMEHNTRPPVTHVLVGGTVVDRDVVVEAEHHPERREQQGERTVTPTIATTKEKMPIGSARIM